MTAEEYTINGRLNGISESAAMELFEKSANVANLIEYF